MKKWGRNPLLKSSIAEHFYVNVGPTFTKIFFSSQWPESKLKKRLEWLCKRKAPKETELDELKKQLMHRHVDSLRKDQQSRLKEWQDEVNQLDTVKIKVENDYDLEGPPRYLKYIHKYYPSEVSPVNVYLISHC